ncbi:carbohydrate kinase family protein [Natrinema zhouii]|uniref:Carbohydrate kinase family protein n=1 Tax=Natrinema zhouii TaxID=1710539 RepID=A0A7D6CNS1_9EURY|nr:carbohydrate kinase family protein [Natrinema zhouii]QLK25069.1 carbohydrate kinase family protein [Natrinema zhouii]
MSYDELCDRLDDLDSSGARRVVTLPDGSVDCWYAIAGEGGDRLEEIDTFADQLATGTRSFALEPIDARPGGQAVNAATQVHALGERATLVGHLDHPVLADFPFETHSMGTPATVRVIDIGSDELQFSEPGPAADWGLEELLAVVDWDRIVDADALCCTNWVSVRGLTAVFDRLVSTPPDMRLPIVVDPGPIDTVDPAALEGLFDALSRADSAATSLEIVLSVNPTELAAAVTATDASDGAVDPVETSGARIRKRTAALRSTLDVSGVVSHGSDAAVGATRDDIAVVEMVDLGDPRRTTGAGDRFSAGLACALAREWPLEPALTLGNACAAHFVATGDTANLAAVRSVCERAD